MRRCSNRQRSWGRCLCRGGACGYQYKGSRRRDAGGSNSVFVSAKACSSPEIKFQGVVPRLRCASLGMTLLLCSTFPIPHTLGADSDPLWVHYLGYLRGVSGRNIVVGGIKGSGLIFRAQPITLGTLTPATILGTRRTKSALGAC